MDAVLFLEQLPVKPQLIITDPPYGMSYKTCIPGSKQWNKTGQLAAAKKGIEAQFEVLQNDDGSIDFSRFYKTCYDTLADDSFLVVCSGWKSWGDWATLIEAAGFSMKTPIFWNKKCANGGDLNDPPISVVEVLIRATKGKPQSYPSLNEQGELKAKIINCWSYGRVPKSEYCGHPTQKPLKIGEQIVRMSTKEGECVVDPFCGSGTFLVSAKKLKRIFYGNDIDPKYVKISEKRLNEYDRTKSDFE
jgi:DNA modification methylase